MNTTHTPGPWYTDGRNQDFNRPEFRIYRDVTFVEGVAPTTYIIGSVTYPTSGDGTVGAAERKANAALIAEAPAMKLALDLIAAGVASIEDGDFVLWVGGVAGGIYPISDTWTATIEAIGWNRAREALAASKGDRNG